MLSVLITRLHTEAIVDNDAFRALVGFTDWLFGSTRYLSGPKSRHRDRNIKMKSDLLVACMQLMYKLLADNLFEYLLIGVLCYLCVVTISSDEYD